MVASCQRGYAVPRRTFPQRRRMRCVYFLQRRATLFSIQSCRETSSASTLLLMSSDESRSPSSVDFKSKRRVEI